MKLFKMVNPDFPSATFEFGLDLSLVETIMNNGPEFNITTYSGKFYRVLKEQSFQTLFKEIEDAKARSYALSRHRESA